MTRTRLYGHASSTATLGMLAAAGYSATFNPWLIIPAAFGAATLACLAAGFYSEDHREHAIRQRLERLRNAEPLRPTALTQQERQALALIEHHLKDAA
jgi:hypothetical protein